MNAVLSQPRLRVFAGPNGSGKSTIHSLLRPEWIGAYVNADDIEKALAQVGRLDLNEFGLAGPTGPLRERITSHLATSTLLARHDLEGVAQQLSLSPDLELTLPPNRVNSYVAAVLADAIRRELLEQGSTFTFETVMSSPDKIAFMQEAQGAGYRTYLYFVATDDAAINIERVRQRVQEGGHNVPEDKIRERYERSIALLDRACAAADRAYIFDNSGEAHELIAEVSGGDQLTLHTDQLPAWFTRTALWQSFQPGAEDPSGAD